MLKSILFMEKLKVLSILGPELGPGLLCSKFYLLFFWALLKNQAYYAQNYAFKIKIMLENW